MLYRCGPRHFSVTGSYNANGEALLCARPNRPRFALRPRSKLATHICFGAQSVLELGEPKKETLVLLVLAELSQDACRLDERIDRLCACVDVLARNLESLDDFSVSSYHIVVYIEDLGIQV
jgi:hypothetical protein